MFAENYSRSFEQLRFQCRDKARKEQLGWWRDRGPWRRWKREKGKRDEEGAGAADMRAATSREGAREAGGWRAELGSGRGPGWGRSYGVRTKERREREEGTSVQGGDFPFFRSLQKWRRWEGASERRRAWPCLLLTRWDSFLCQSYGVGTPYVLRLRVSGRATQRSLSLSLSPLCSPSHACCHWASGKFLLLPKKLLLRSRPIAPRLPLLFPR